MARILLVAGFEWARAFHAYQLSDGEHLVKSIGFTPRLAEEITSFRPEVIVADLSGEHDPADLLWRTVTTLPEPRLPVVFSTNANYWGAVYVSQDGNYEMKVPLPDALPEVVENVLYRQGLDNSSGAASSQTRMEH
ncbi:hypothetical protein [Desulfoferula mesophila]|uniref:Response regulatory domain-containing protein n=1 Tax=Desulfoferula mesophila TaxID=3058419 RepID=A0AAU9EHY1_9BACT|nr:hypothetical protein FAK_09310 [Desulfoferula mesophilus]BEQ14179.1 hypothetical protein FAK_12450 [Desulfoferula mesophilus]